MPIETKTLSAAAAGYENRDVRFWPVLISALGLAAFCALSMWTMKVMFETLNNRLSHIEQQARPTAITGGGERFPEPRLEINGREDFAAYRARQEAELNSYGWMDKKAGVVRIPIDRAMDLLAQKGLPVRQPGQPPKADKTPLDMIQERRLERGN